MFLKLRLNLDLLMYELQLNLKLIASEKQLWNQRPLSAKTLLKHLAKTGIIRSENIPRCHLVTESFPLFPPDTSLKPFESQKFH